MKNPMFTAFICSAALASIGANAGNAWQIFQDNQAERECAARENVFACDWVLQPVDPLGAMIKAGERGDILPAPVQGE